jgi:uncharacterized protein YciI
LPIVPHREAHEAHIVNFKKTAGANIMAAPFFPYSGAVFFIQTNAAQDPENAVEAFVKADPYHVKGLISEYSVKPVAMTHISRDFDRLADDFIVRS